MSTTRRTNQGGAVLTFIIIAVVLAAAAITTAYVVRQRGEQARRDQAIVQAEKPAESPAPSAESDDNAAVQSTDDTPATPESSPSASSESATPLTPPVQSELPTTGPIDDAFKVIASALLVGSGVAYIASRRYLARSL